MSNFWHYKRAMCVKCTAQYKNTTLKYGCLRVSTCNEGRNSYNVITTIAMKVMVHHNMFQHCMVTNRTVYREATMQISQREKWVSR